MGEEGRGVGGGGVKPVGLATRESQHHGPTQDISHTTYRYYSFYNHGQRGGELVAGETPWWQSGRGVSLTYLLLTAHHACRVAHRAAGESLYRRQKQAL